MAGSVALSYWPITIVPESKLSHMATVHYGFVPKLSHHGGKTVKTERRSQTYSYTALHFTGKRLRFFSGAMFLPSVGLNHISGCDKCYGSD